MLAKLCRTLPDDHVDCACFRQRVCKMVSYLLKSQIIQVSMTGVTAGAVKTLVELIYRGTAPLEPEVLLNSLDVEKFSALQYI